MIGSGASFLLALLLLEYTPIHPIVGMISFSVSLALGPVALVSSVPLILPLSLVGTGMGLIKSGTNVGASIFDILTGFLQDHDAHKGYESVIDFFIIIVTLSILSGITLLVLNRIMYDNLLDAASSAETKQEQLTERLKSNYFYAGLYIVLVIVSWIMFIRFIFK